MATFLFQNLLWIGLPMIALPVLIHLINMMRHQKIEWAAMEFLLVSMKKNSSWIMLKQLLLLLMRMAAVAAIAFMVAQPSLRNRLGKFFGGGTVHHVILLDDSYSMGDKWGETTALEQAKQEIVKLLTSAERQQTSQDVTLYRFSQMVGQDRALRPDFANLPLTTELLTQLPGSLQKFTPSDLTLNPVEPFDKLLKTVQENSDQSYVVYMVSDFRAKDWNQPAELEKRIAEFNKLNVIPKLIQAVDKSRPNLAITQLRALPGPRVSNVTLPMEVVITNYGEKVRNLQVTIVEDEDKRRTEVIDELDKGKSISRRFEVLFNRAGEHVIKAQIAEGLTADAVRADNSRYAVVECEAENKVLLIEGNEKELNSSYVDSAFLKKLFNQKSIGLNAEVQTRKFLRNNQRLTDYHSIFLLNVERLEESERKALEEYALAGGGIAWFVGNMTDPGFYTNTLYAPNEKGQRLFPAPLENQIALLPAKTEPVPDINITPHEIFQFSPTEDASAAKQQSERMFKDILVQRYLAASKQWKPADDGATVIAKLRNGFPLAITHRYGAGSVVTFLTSVSPMIDNNDSSTTWINWTRANTTFGTTMLQLQAYLGRWKQTDSSRPVGTPLVWKPRADVQYSPEVEILTPYEGIKSTVKTQFSDGEIKYDDTELAGIYRVNVKTQSDNQLHSHLFPFNLQTGDATAVTAATPGPAANAGSQNTNSPQILSESNLTVITTEKLRTDLQNVKFDFLGFDQLGSIGSESEKNNLSTTILYLLVALLVGEQLLAYSASYHTPARETA
jgi:hypothetical protein